MSELISAVCQAGDKEPSRREDGVSGSSQVPGTSKSKVKGNVGDTVPGLWLGLGCGSTAEDAEDEDLMEGCHGRGVSCSDSTS